MAKGKVADIPTPIGPTSALANMEVGLDLGNVKVPDKTPREKLNEALAALPVDNLGDGMDLTSGGKIKSTTIVINPPNMPTNEALGIAAAQSTAAAVAGAASKVTMDANVASALSALADAPKFREKITTKATQTIIDGNLVQIPPQVRDLPARLYQDNNNNYVRGEADALLKGTFGEVAALADMWAKKRGFGQTPLVYLSSMIYRYVELNKKVDYASPITYARPVYDAEGLHSKGTEPVTYIANMPFNADIDDNDDGPLLPHLYKWLYHLTVRNLVRIGKEYNLSVLDVLRCIVAQYDRDNKPRPTVKI